MSEQEFNEKKDLIIANSSAKLKEIESLKQHFEERVKVQGAPIQGEIDQNTPASFDVKIFQRLS